jgi:4-hydroxy-tetrahydrodipicolinate synthase
MMRDELKARLRGPIAALPTPFDEHWSLNLAVTADLIHWCIAHGIVLGKAPLKVAAALGEGPDLTDDEWPRLLQTTVKAAANQADVICGLKPKDTLHTIEDAKKAQDLGAIGVQIDLPIFHHPTQDDIVRFFTDISEAIDIGILIYNTYWFGACVTAESMLRLADAEHVIGIKWDVPADVNYDDMTQFAHLVNVIDNSGQPIRCYQNGGSGYIDATAGVFPPHALGIWERIEAGQFDEVEALWERVNKPLSQFYAQVSRRSGGYSVPKAMLALLGLPVGNPRPPTLPLTGAEHAELGHLMTSFGWPVTDAALIGQGG